MIEVLRLNHRIKRDPRISTHLALVSRAFGALKIYYSGDKDSEMENIVNKVTDEFGGPFEIEHIKDEIKFIKEKKKERFFVIHLTCYGLEIKKEIGKIKKFDNILVIVGGSKVQGEIYNLSDFNISVTNQPHSELAALTIFLDKYFDSKELDKKFINAKSIIIPKERGKLVKKVTQ
ncbi:MAG: tRNA (cytidine(56)-2'-O)-methyltransferase [Nanoarchaeota archaeon]|nr:tRNA (cytidine(56)-2'-O)-methyltransferase [Nanoarchaeota archaeon]MBU0962463.1 tRNA (cytidine(56)-2'-O)-methyltransferase [Nanoarchaeota archaeon]